MIDTAPPDTAPHTDDQAQPDREWWLTLRRVVDRAIGLLETASAADATLRRDLVRLFEAPPTALNQQIQTTVPPVITPSVPASSKAATSQLPLRDPSHPAVVSTGLKIEPKFKDPNYSERFRGSTGIDLQIIADNCRVKYETTLAGSLARTSTDRLKHFVAWLKTPTREPDHVVAGCYLALAEAADLMVLSERVSRNEDNCLRLLSEAQSAVRALKGTRHDEQDMTYRWFKERPDLPFLPYLSKLAVPKSHANLRHRLAVERRKFEKAVDGDAQGTAMRSPVGTPTPAEDGDEQDQAGISSAERLSRDESGPATVEEAVTRAKNQYPLLLFGNDVEKEVRGLAADAGPPHRILEYFGGLAELAHALQNGPLGVNIIQWLKDRDFHASGESETIQNSRTEMKQRTWHDGRGRREFVHHLKPTDVTSPDRCVRIYFEWDKGLRTMIVGSVGRKPGT